MHDIFEDFVRRYDGPKLAFVVTGGGIGIHQLAQTLGVSKILHAIYVPYSYEESTRFIAGAVGSRFAHEYAEKAVSEQGAKLLVTAGTANWPDCTVIACTAATTTNRFRRGDNQAFMALSKPCPAAEERKISYHHLGLSKISEEDFKMMGLGYAAWKRRNEDMEISKYLLKLALGEC